MPAFLDVFGGVPTGLGIVSISQSLMPSLVDQTQHHQVRVWAGLGFGAARDQGGNIPIVNLWDGLGQFIGASAVKIGEIGAGQFHDYIVDPFSAGNNRAAEYLSVSAIGSNDLCIAALSVTTPDSEQSVMLGDLPAYCGAQWYHSSLAMGPSVQPRCFWVTNQISSTRKYQGFGVHLTDFVADQPISKQYKSNRASCCHSTARFSMFRNIGSKDSIPFYSPPLQFTTNGTDLNPDGIPTAPTSITSKVFAANIQGVNTGSEGDGVASGASALIDGKPDVSAEITPRWRRGGQRRQNKAREGASQRNSTDRSWQQHTARQTATDDTGDLPYMGGHLVISSMTYHSAELLCTDENSAGPDFVSVVEGLYCDMAEKVLYPLCSASTNGTACFDRNTNSMCQAAILNTRSADGNLVFASSGAMSKSYSNVIQWD